MHKMHQAEFEDGTGSRRPLLGDAGVSPRQVLCCERPSVFKGLFSFVSRIDRLCLLKRLNAPVAYSVSQEGKLSSEAVRRVLRHPAAQRGDM